MREYGKIIKDSMILIYSLYFLVIIKFCEYVVKGREKDGFL